MYKEIFTATVTALAGFIGVYLGYYLTESSKINDNKKSFLIETISKAEARTLRTEMVIWSAKTPDTFEKRWDSYIENGLVPWDASYSRTELGLFKLFPNKPQYLNLVRDLNQEYKIVHTTMVNTIHTSWSRKADINLAALSNLQEKANDLEKKSTYFSAELWVELNNLE